MKKILWILIVLFLVVGFVYYSMSSGRFGAFSSFRHSGGFEAFFDETAKEISTSQHLAQTATFNVSYFENAYGEENGVANIVENGIRNALSQALPGRVAAYRNYVLPATVSNKKEEHKKADKTQPDANTDENADAVSQTSGHFVISGTYKEEDGFLIVNVYAADAENGRGYYARRLAIPVENFPMLFQKKPVEKTAVPVEVQNPTEEQQFNVQPAAEEVKSEPEGNNINHEVRADVEPTETSTEDSDPLRNVIP